MIICIFLKSNKEIFGSGSACISFWKKIHPTLDRIFHKKKTKINQKCTTPLIFSFAIAINHIKHKATL